MHKIGLLALASLVNAQAGCGGGLRIVGAPLATGVVGIGGNGMGVGNGAVTVRTCCDRNRDKIAQLDDKISFVENDMGDRFSDDFDRIDTLLNDVERRIDELEIR